MPAARTGYANVGIDGDAYGLYLNLENLNKSFLERWFDSTLHLYEVDYPPDSYDEVHDFYPGQEVLYEVDEGDEADLSDLQAFIAAVNEAGPDWWQSMAAVADRNELLRMWAVELYVAIGTDTSSM